VYSGGDVHAVGDTAYQRFRQLSASDAALMGKARLVRGVHNTHCVRGNERIEMIAFVMAALLAVIGFLCVTDGIAAMGLNPGTARRDEKSVKQISGK